MDTKRVQPPPVGGMLGLGELPGRSYTVVQRLHGLLDRGVGIEAMDLVEIHVVHARAPQRRVDPVEDMHPGQPTVVGRIAHRPVDLGGQHVVLSTWERLAQQRPGDLLAHPERVHVSSVEERDSGLGGPADERSRRT
jgi:hypothetical protein